MLNMSYLVRVVLVASFILKHVMNAACICSKRFDVTDETNRLAVILANTCK